MEHTTSIGWAARSRARSEDACDRISQWILFLMPIVFVAFCALLISLWYVDILTGWLIAAFALLIEAMLIGIGFFVFVMMRISRRRRRERDARTALCYANQPDDTDLPFPVGFDGVKTVHCMFRSGQVGAFRVSCYNTNCPFMHGAEETERLPRQAEQAHACEVPSYEK
ncbi:Uncharacterised protein [Burkholderia oklahomensis]|nr:Uncharacterised protein [Burkholderia oklahomensis]